MPDLIRFTPHPQTPPPALAELLDTCFGTSRHLKTASVIRTQASRIDSASFLAMSGDQLLGSVECWHIVWEGPTAQPMALLGPLAAHPDRRRQRIGWRLMDLALAALDRLQSPVVLIGDEPYYGRWGFAADYTRQWRLPGPVERHRLLLRCSDGARFDAPASIVGNLAHAGAHTGRALPA